MDACDLPSTKTTSYYAVLGVSSDSSADEIRRAFRKLALQWHPDRWTRCAPSMLNRAKRKFQQIQEAYSVLSDKKKRRLYDAGLYDRRDEEEDEGFYGFLQEMVSLMAQTRRERESYSLQELRAMLSEMAGGGLEDPAGSKRPRFEAGFGSCRAQKGLHFLA